MTNKRLLKHFNFLMIFSLFYTFVASSANDAKIWHSDCVVTGLNVYSYTQHEENRRAVIEALRLKDFTVNDNVTSVGAANHLRGLFVQIGTQEYTSPDFAHSELKHIVNTVSVQGF